MHCKLIAAILAFVAAVSAAEKGCAGGYQEGATVERGRYWYVCQDGQLAPKGCFSDDKKKLNLKETFKSGGYVLECTVDEKGFLSFRYKGCVTEGGKEFGAGETIEDGKYWFTCTSESDKLRMEASGCVEEGKRYKIGETVEKESIGYECQRRTSDSACSLCPAKCIEGGKSYAVGEKFNVDKFVYECMRDETGKKVVRKCVGCVHATQQLQDGDRYIDGDSVYECAIRQDKTPEHRLVGCHDSDQGLTIERRLHCQWTKGTPPLRYVMACDSKDEKVANKQVVKCYYGDEKQGYEIEPGCYKPVEDKLMAACTGTGENIKLETFPADQVQEAYKKNVKFCP